MALFVAPLFMESIEGVDGHPAAARLIASLLQPAVTRAYRHKFSSGDLVVWDNRRMLHSATPMPKRLAGDRIIHRIRMSSKEVPYGPHTQAAL